MIAIHIEHGIIVLGLYPHGLVRQHHDISPATWDGDCHSKPINAVVAMIDGYFTVSKLTVVWG